jgi:hypothetical protein
MDKLLIEKSQLANILSIHGMNYQLRCALAIVT